MPTLCRILLACVEIWSQIEFVRMHVMHKHNLAHLHNLHKLRYYATTWCHDGIMCTEYIVFRLVHVNHVPRMPCETSLNTGTTKTECTRTKSLTLSRQRGDAEQRWSVGSSIVSSTIPPSRRKSWASAGDVTFLRWTFVSLLRKPQYPIRWIFIR